MKRYLIYILSVLTLGAAEKVWAQATIGSLDQQANQVQGQYQPMNMGYAGFNSIGQVQSAWLDPLQNLGEGQSKPAYSRYYWSPDLVLPIRVRAGMITLVNFPEWELVEDIRIGDGGSFDFDISGPSSILIYPKEGTTTFGVDTNMVVFGRSGNKYVFYVRSESVNTERLTNSVIDIEVIDSPKNGASAGVSGSGTGGRLNANNFKGSSGNSAFSSFTKRYQKEDWIQSIPLDPTKFRFDVEVYVPNPDDVVIAPERVWRDDIFTYIDFGERSLSMLQRPIVTLIVERMETPVGFRTKGPNSRLLIVEGIGDMVLRSGKRIICLKLRRSDDAGLEFAPMAETNDWDVPPAYPEGVRPTTSGEVQGFDSSFNDSQSVKSPQGYISMGSAYGSNAYPQNESVVGEQVYHLGKDGELIVPDYADSTNPYSNSMNKGQVGGGNVSSGNKKNGYSYGTGFEGADAASISVELGTDADVNNLENLWGDLSRKYSSVLSGYQPFYSVDAPADGQGRELFHLRIGPVKSIDSGDRICNQLGRNGIFCSVVRIQ